MTQKSAVLICFAEEACSHTYLASNWHVVSGSFQSLDADAHFIYRHINIQQFYVLPTQLYLFMCFVWISEQTAIISVYSIN